MESKPRKPGGAFKVFALALMSCLALAAVAASSASALSLKLPNPPDFTASSNSIEVLGSGGTGSVWCDGGMAGSGTFVNETQAVATLELHECRGVATSKSICTSSGAESGTIVTAPLKVDLAELPEEAGPGLVFEPFVEEENFADFTCSGGFPVEWSGGLIGELTAPEYNTPSNKLSVRFRASAWGIQEYTETADGRKAQLEISVNGGAKHDVSFDTDATLSAVEGGEFELSPEEPERGDSPSLSILGEYPLSSSWYGGEVTLRFPSLGHVTCTTSGEPPVLGLTGGGEFSNSTEGDVELTLRNCSTVFNIKCTSPGQPTGTVKTESLPVKLAYLSDGGPGLALSASESSGKVMEMNCSFAGKVVVTGDVLGRITSPELGSVSSWLTNDMNAVEEGEGFVQEYTETQGGEEHGLQVSHQGGEPQPASLDLYSGVTTGEPFLLSE